jgi:hypothetical protein
MDPGFRVGLSILVGFVGILLILGVLFLQAGADVPSGEPTPVVSAEAAPARHLAAEAELGIFLSAHDA